MCRAKAGIERKLSTPAFSFSHNKNFSQGDLKENQVALFLFHRKELSLMPLFTTKPTDQLFEWFMKHHVSPAGSGVAPQWGVSSTDRSGS